VASLLLEQFRAPAGTRDARVHDWARKQTLERLAGRTVWCAERLGRHLEWSAGGGVRADPLRAPEDVRPGDIVVLHHPLAAAEANELRERGAHAIWHVLSAQERAPAVDAYLMTGTSWAGEAFVVALVPAADVVFAKEMRGATYEDIGWCSLLADVVGADREECVGGTLHARPAVAAR
jgi:hypothetical protein